MGDNFGIWPNSKYPTIFVPGAQYTVADSLLLEQSYDEAIQAYDEALKKNPNDSHALQMLSRLYTLGYKAPYFDDEKNTGVDITKAIDYTERLLALTSDEEYTQSLAHLYMQNKAYDKALFYFQQVKKRIILFTLLWQESMNYRGILIKL